MLIVFALSLKWHLGSLQDYSENRFRESSWEILGVIVLISISEVGFAMYG
jgi:hypothetical protein